MVKKVLSINHSDTSTNSGIQADLQIFQENNVFGFTAITSLTIDGGFSKSPIEVIEPLVIQKQLESVFSDGAMDAIKIGSLNVLQEAEIIKSFIENYDIQNVILEVELEKIEEQYFQLLLPLAKIIVIKDSHQSFTDIEIKKITHKLYQKNLTWVCLQNGNTFLVYDGKNYFTLKHNSDDISAYLTAQLAKKEQIDYLLDSI